MSAFSPSWLSPLVAPLKWGFGVMQARTPLTAYVHVGRRPPTILVTIINKTQDVPLHVHEVRIHLGLKRYSYFFQLTTDGTATIPSKDKREFHLPYERTIVGQHYESNELPNLHAEDSGPGFDSPADLFKAIARSKPEDSWLEIDFNEYRKRRFLQGRVQSFFHDIAKNPPPKPIEE